MPPRRSGTEPGRSLRVPRGGGGAGLITVPMLRLAGRVSGRRAFSAARASPGAAPLVGTVTSVERARLCNRPGCAQSATAELVFQYGTRTLWLEDLGEPDPH